MDFCFRCGECCKNEVVILTTQEALLLESKLGSILQGTTIVKNGEIFFLWDLKLTKGCPFIKNNEKGFFCSVYDVRPSMCRMYHCGRININEPRIVSMMEIRRRIDTNDKYREYKAETEADGASWGNAHGWHWRK